MAETLLPVDDTVPDPGDPGEPGEVDDGEFEDAVMPPENGMPPSPEPLGLMVAFLPSDIELEQIAVEGGLADDDLHMTLRYYGPASQPDFIEQVHEAARTIAGNIPPFVASVAGRRQLGGATPPADVLVLADHKAFRLALDRLPPSDNDYPAFTPHITVGYGLDDATMAKSNPDNEVLFDHIVVAQGNDDWTVYMLGDIPPEALDDVNPDALVDTTGDRTDEVLADGGDDPAKRTLGHDVPEVAAGNPVTAGLDDGRYTLADLTPEDLTNPARHLDAATLPVTAGIGGMIDGQINAPGSRVKSKTVGKLDPRPSGKKQVCYHGTPATCKSVKWLSVYRALRDKGFTKSHAAATANNMHNRWKRGSIGPHNHHPIIRRTV
jgi:2'-5' RNA ligase